MEKCERKKAKSGFFLKGCACTADSTACRIRPVFARDKNTGTA